MQLVNCCEFLSFDIGRKHNMIRYDMGWQISIHHTCFLSTLSTRLLRHRLILPYITKYLRDKTFDAFSIHSLSAHVFLRIVCRAMQSYRGDAHTGAVLEGFLRFPETTQDFPSTMGAPLFGCNVSRGIHSGLNSGV